MPLPRRKMFGRYDERRQAYCLSDYPPDAPVQPSVIFEDDCGVGGLEDSLAYFLKRKRIDVRWYPPLTMERAAMLDAAVARLKSS